MVHSSPHQARTREVRGRCTMPMLRWPRAAGRPGQLRPRPRHMVSQHSSSVLANFGERRPNGGRGRGQKGGTQPQNWTPLSFFYFSGWSLWKYFQNNQSPGGVLEVLSVSFGLGHMSNHKGLYSSRGRQPARLAKPRARGTSCSGRQTADWPGQGC